MDANQEITISLPNPIYAQAQALAAARGLTLNALLNHALEQLVQPELSPTPSGSHSTTPVQIRQGDVFWLHLDHPDSVTTGVAHPHVVIQDDLFNQSRVPTVLVCALTSNRKRATEPGNVLLQAGEANLSKVSVLLVSQISAVNKSELGAYIGSLSPQRIEQMLDGLRFQQAGYFGR
ncbi:MAG: type II toxin-antitoxin system PemK/MazF family toxin [Candidatus Melainabacteria bacterium HGW-Melainabacteria-1]|nr:MAG: type II toxin-antitoxin system PemK/MazF family toxin [Candidatus Melainabacteria bacterium HGW-Melainabacteria-1]